MTEIDTLIPHFPVRGRIARGKGRCEGALASLSRGAGLRCREVAELLGNGYAIAVAFAAKVPIIEDEP